MTERSKENLISSVYFDLKSPASYAGMQKVLSEAKRQNPKIKLSDVENFLQKQSTYTLYRPGRKRFKRLKTVPDGLNTDWQCDLAIFDTLSKNNDGYKYLLVCIDVLSRKLYVAPSKSKSSKFMIDAFEVIFKKAKTKPHKLYSDRGLEFQAGQMLKYFKENDVIKLVVYSPDIHAGVVERANRTIKERLYRYFHKNKTHRWVDIIDKIADGINNSVNRTIGIAPNKVTYENAQRIRNKVYGDAFTPNKRPKYKDGDLVRISEAKGVFSKGYHPNYTMEIFKIKVVKESNPPHYKLEDLKGEDILGVFYEPELSKVQTNQMGKGGWLFKPILWPKTI